MLEAEAALDVTARNNQWQRYSYHIFVIATYQQVAQ